MTHDLDELFEAMSLNETQKCLIREAIEERTRPDLERWTILGRPVSEVIDILNGLDLERITGIAMTMEKLRAYKDLMAEEQQRVISDHIERVVERIGK